MTLRPRLWNFASKGVAYAVAAASSRIIRLNHMTDRKVHYPVMKTVLRVSCCAQCLGKEGVSAVMNQAMSAGLQSQKCGAYLVLDDRRHF